MPRPVPSAHLGDAILDARRAAGLSQAAAAKRAELAVETWSRIERSRITPGIDALTRIAIVLGISLDELVGLKPPKTPKAPALRPAERRLLEAVAELDEADVETACQALTVLLSIQPPPRRRGRL